MKFKRVLSLILALACVGIWVLPGFVVSVDALDSFVVNKITSFDSSVSDSKVKFQSPVYDNYAVMFDGSSGADPTWLMTSDPGTFTSGNRPTVYQNFAECPNSYNIVGNELFYIRDILDSGPSSVYIEVPFSIAYNNSHSRYAKVFYYDSNGDYLSSQSIPGSTTSYSFSGSFYFQLTPPENAVYFGFSVWCMPKESAWNSTKYFSFVCNSFTVEVRYPSADDVPDFSEPEDEFEPLPYSGRISQLKVLEKETDIGTDVTYAFTGSHYYSWSVGLSTPSVVSDEPLNFSCSGEPNIYSHYQFNEWYSSDAGLANSVKFYVGDLPISSSVSAKFKYPFKINDSGNSFNISSLVTFYDSSHQEISREFGDMISFDSSSDSSGEYVHTTTFPSGTCYFTTTLCVNSLSNADGQFNLDASGFSLTISYNDSFVSTPAEIIDVSKWDMVSDTSQVTHEGGIVYDHYSCFDYKALIEYWEDSTYAFWAADYNVSGFEAYKWRIPLIVTNEYHELSSSKNTQVYDISSLWTDDVVNISVVYHYIVNASDAPVDLSLELFATGVDSCGNRTGTPVWVSSDGLYVTTSINQIGRSIECNIGSDISSYMQCWLDITRSEDTSDGRPIIRITDFEVVVMRKPVESEIPPAPTEPPTEPSDPSEPSSGNVDLSGVESQLGNIDSSLNDMSGSISSGFADVHDDIADLGDDITSGLDDVETAIGNMDTSINQGLDDLGDQIGDDLENLQESIDAGLSDVESAIDDTNDKIKESNSLLGSVVEGITSLPQKILDGIVGLFVPSEEDFQEYNDKWDELLRSRFGALYESVDLIDEYAGTMEEKAATNTVTFPAVTLDLAGVPFSFGGWDVRVVPEGFDEVFDMLKWMISIIATLGMVNALRNKFERLLGGA